MCTTINWISENNLNWHPNAQHPEHISKKRGSNTNIRNQGVQCCCLLEMNTSNKGQFYVDSSNASCYQVKLVIVFYWTTCVYVMCVSASCVQERSIVVNRFYFVQWLYFMFVFAWKLWCRLYYIFFYLATSFYPHHFS